jgi:hypothetical protein
VLVIGYGDGALTDLMRACIIDFEHEVVLNEVIRRAASGGLLEEIRAIESHPRSSRRNYWRSLSTRRAIF